MTNYSAQQTVISASREELIEIFRWVHAREKNEKYPITVLVGGWAVYSAALAAWLERRGFARGYAWMKFSRPCDASFKAATDLELRVVGREHGADFGRVVTEGFGLPAAIAAWVSMLPGRAHWVCVMAFAGSAPAAAGAAYLQGEHAWLGFGATLPAFRRHGAQNALLARRLTEAASRGARTAVTETGERLPDKPSNSYRNILRAGFHEKYLRHNYLSPPP